MKLSKIFPLACLLLALVTFKIILEDKEQLSFIAILLLIASSIQQMRLKREGRWIFYAYASLIALSLFFDLLFQESVIRVPIFNSRLLFITHIIFATLGTAYLRFLSWRHPDPPEVEDGKSLSVSAITENGLVGQDGSVTPWKDIAVVEKHINLSPNYSDLGGFGVFSHTLYSYYIKQINNDDKIKLSNLKLMKTISFPKWKDSSQSNTVLEIKKLIEYARKYPHIKFVETSNLYEEIKPLNLQNELKLLEKLR